MERQRQGDIATFAFIDNLARSITYLGRVLVDLAPYVLDTERIIRLGMEDGLQKFEAINVNTGTNILNNLSIGKYDVVVSVGPSYATMREEARRSMSEFIQYYPQAAPFIGDLFAKSMDWKGADDFAERLRYLLPPEIRDKVMKTEAQKTGKEVQAEPQQPPDPMLVAKLQEEQLKLQESQLSVEQEKVKLQQEAIKLEQMKLDLESKVSGNKEAIRSIIDELIQEDMQQMSAPQMPQQIIPQQNQVPPPPSEEEFMAMKQAGQIPPEMLNPVMPDQEVNNAS
jgi:hypothetical protein